MWQSVNITEWGKKTVTNYREYLQSDHWKRKRDTRLIIDKKCQICGRPFDLQVHHMTYENLPYERNTDLITLCDYCHRSVEKMKNYASQSSFSIVRKLIIKQFIKEYLDRDYSHKGDLDLCQTETIKRLLYPYITEHGLSADYCGGTKEVNDYFRNRRYEIILEMMESGAEPSDIFRYYKFSQSMVYKVFKNPQKAKELLEKERSEDAET